MHKGRLEAFSDAVIAIAITVMVLELHAPAEGTLAALSRLWPDFASYALSFLFLAIYWNNHHHMLQRAQHVDGGVLWANMHLLFWLSLIPFVTAWVGNAGITTEPIAAYGVVLFSAAIAYYILARALVRANGPDSPLAHALGRDLKGKVSVVIYAIAIGLAFAWPPAAGVLYLAVALMWLVPDRRFERERSN